MRGQREIWIGIRTPVSGGGRGGGDLRGLRGRGGGVDLCRRRFGRSRSAGGSDGWEFAICKKTKETKKKIKNPRRDFRILRNLWRENRELPNSQASIPFFSQRERGGEMMELWKEREDQIWGVRLVFIYTCGRGGGEPDERNDSCVYCDSCVLFWACQHTWPARTI